MFKISVTPRELARLLQINGFVLEVDTKEKKTWRGGRRKKGRAREVVSKRSTPVKATIPRKRGRPKSVLAAKPKQDNGGGDLE